MFDSHIGRWLEEDPIGFNAGDPNLYRYVGNNPTNHADPSGLAIPLPDDPFIDHQLRYRLVTALIPRLNDRISVELIRGLALRAILERSGLPPAQIERRLRQRFQDVIVPLVNERDGLLGEKAWLEQRLRGILR